MPIHRPSVEELEPRVLMTVVCNANPQYRAECDYYNALLPHSAITITAIQSGRWADPATWGGRTPAGGDNVWIPAGIAVTLDDLETAAIRSVLDNGLLQFAPDQNTSLYVDTLVVGTDDNPTGQVQGELRIGTAASPIQAGIAATLVFTDGGALAQTAPNDPRQLSRGLISMGTVSIYGAPLTPWVSMYNAARGSNTLQLATVPQGWKAGDVLLIPGTNPAANQDEQIAIASLSSQGGVVVVTLAGPLAYDHAAPSGLSVYVANTSRNVTLQSQNAADPTRHGHVMFMHTDQETVAYAAFLNLGRTDKSKVLNDPQFDASGNLIPGTGTNPRGRYALHFHRDYWPALSGSDPPIQVVGNYVSGSPGWGYVNHSSNVAFQDNISFNVLGSGFATEAGNEVGSFVHNLAVRSAGAPDGGGRPGTPPAARNAVNDFGFEGNGFWFQGGNVTVQGNVAAGQHNSAFAFVTAGLFEKDFGAYTKIFASDLVNPAWAAGAGSLDVEFVPLRSFTGNTSYGNGLFGLFLWSNLRTIKSADMRSVCDGFSTWNTFGSFGAVYTDYVNNFTLQNSTILGDFAFHSRIGAQFAFGYSDFHGSGFLLAGNRIEGWDRGVLHLGNTGHLAVSGGWFNNGNIDISLVSDEGGTEIAGAVFGPRSWYHVYIDAHTLPLSADPVFLDGKQVFPPEQAPAYVPFPSSKYAASYPPEMLDRTNQQLFDAYGLSVGGAPASADAAPAAKVYGTVGSPVSYLPAVTLLSRPQTSAALPYYLSYRDVDGTVVTETTPVTLTKGRYNLLTRQLGGRARSFLVYGT